MKLSQFKFKLPEELIALTPTNHRDESRMMVLHKKSGKIEHKTFKDFIEYFDEKDLLLFNDTKVFPARIYGNKEKTGARIEVFLLRELNPETRLWDVLVDPARKIRIGNKLYFGPNDELVAEVIDNTTSRGRTLRFLYDGPHEEFIQTLHSLGETPIPPIIKSRRDVIDVPIDDENPFTDRERYQTIYAHAEGGVVAPEAGLHFSRELMKRLEIKGVEFGFVTVHSNQGNFRNIDVEDLTKHKMDSEKIIIPEAVADLANVAIDNNRHLCAVDPSVARALETSVSTTAHLKPYEGWINKFIFPPFDFRIADSLVANFYPPYSILLMIAAAFGGYDFVMNAYHLAVKEHYRFGTYGDAMLILND